MSFELLFFIVLFKRLYCEITCTPKPGFPVDNPIGVARGINPGRVSWEFNKKCCNWNGDNSTYFWEDVNQEIVDQMLANSILKLSSSETIIEAWDKIFTYFHDHTENDFSKDNKTEDQGNSLVPQTLKALLRQLVNDFDIPQEGIIIYDCARWFPEFFWFGKTGIGSEFPNVTLYDNAGEKEYTKKCVPDYSTNMYFSNKNVPNWNGTKVPKFLVESDYLVVLNNMRGHDLAGVTLSSKNHFGSIYRSDITCNFGSYNAGHWCPKSLHGFVNVKTNEMGKYNPLVDLNGYTHFGKKTILYMVDGLYSGIAEHQWNLPIKYRMYPFSNHWSSSIFTSLDPVAIDSVLFDILRNEPNQPYTKEGCIDNYLHEASECPNSKSKTIYNPSGSAILQSLGVHEHWSDINTMTYSGYHKVIGKNKTINGIDLVKNFGSKWSKNHTIMITVIIIVFSACFLGILLAGIVLFFEIGIQIMKKDPNNQLKKGYTQIQDEK